MLWNWKESMWAGLQTLNEKRASCAGKYNQHPDAKNKVLKIGKYFFSLNGGTMTVILNDAGEIVTTGGTETAISIYPYLDADTLDAYNINYPYFVWQGAFKFTFEPGDHTKYANTIFSN